MLPPFREDFDDEQPSTNRFKSTTSTPLSPVKVSDVDEIQEENKETKLGDVE